MMRTLWLVIFSAGIAGLGVGGCASLQQIFETAPAPAADAQEQIARLDVAAPPPPPPPPPPKEEVKEQRPKEIFVGGGGRIADVDAASLCGGREKVVSVENVQSLRNSVTRFISVGLYTPRRFKVTCLH